jgi:hypothetical protein
MKAIIEGQEHQILGEPTPQIIHGLFAPELAPPVIVEDYEEQLRDMYRANGRICRVRFRVYEGHEDTVGQRVEWFEEGVRREGRQIQPGGLLGPIARPDQRLAELGFKNFDGFAIWYLR